MDKQIILLFAALNGYLDRISIDAVAQYEAELYNYYDNSPYKYPLEGELAKKNNFLDTSVVSFLLKNFTKAFELISVDGNW